MAKIPQYKSTIGSVQSGFRAPNLKDATVPILQGISRVTNEVLDKRAATQGKEKGFSDVNRGAVTINQAEAKPNTIRGAAYKEGARSSFLSKTKNTYETELTELYNIHKLDSEAFTKARDKLKENVLQNTPSSLQQALTIDFDGESLKYSTQINTNVFNREELEQLKNQTDRLTTLSDKIEDSISIGAVPGPWNDFGGEDTEKMVAEYVTILSSLYNEQKKIGVKELSQYSDILFDNILNAEIMSAYKVAQQGGQGQEFIEKLEDGGYKQFIKEISSSYGDEIKEALPQFEVPSTISQKQLNGIIKTLNSELKEDFRINQAGRTLWEQDATKALKLYEGGVDPGYIFDSEKMRSLGFKESTILKYEASFRVAEAVYPDIIEAKSTIPNENATILKSIQSEYYQLQNKKNLNADDREQLIVLGAKIDGVGTVLSNQRKWIEDGDINLLFDQAGVSYDTSTVEGMNAYHKQAEELFGLDSSLMKVAPQSQLDADAELITTGNFESIIGMSDKYGEYFETFIVDSGLDKQGYITVAQLINNGNPKFANQVFNALRDMEANTKSAKNLHGDFTDENKTFEDQFLTGDGVSGFDGFGEYLTGNDDLADDVMNSARALWTQIYLKTGDNAKASTGVIKYFTQNFNMFEFNGMKVLLPNGVDSDAITEQLEIFANNPQKKGIMTNSLFDINDFKEDFSDNNIENYDLVIDGGTIKIINKENAMGVATIFKKLPSGSNEFGYSNTIVVPTKKKDDVSSHMNLHSAEVGTNDVVDIWHHNSKIGNKKFTSVVNDAISQTVTTYDIEKEKYTEQQKEIMSTINVPLYEKYKQFDVDGDGQLNVVELRKAKEWQAKNTIAEPSKVTTFKKVEALHTLYKKHFKNAPLDESIGTITKDATVQEQLQAISFYMKDGEMTDWILDYLSEIESFENLNDDTFRKEVLANWKNNRDRKTDTNPPTIMSPIMALYDYVRDIEDSDTRIDDMMKKLIKKDEKFGVEYIPFG